MKDILSSATEGDIPGIQNCLDSGKSIGILLGSFETGISVNIQDPELVTPLIAASWAGQTEACIFLLSQGADPDLAQVDGNRSVCGDVRQIL